MNHTVGKRHDSRIIGSNLSVSIRTYLTHEHSALFHFRSPRGLSSSPAPHQLSSASPVLPPLSFRLLLKPSTQARFHLAFPIPTPVPRHLFLIVVLILIQNNNTNTNNFNDNNEQGHQWRPNRARRLCQTTVCLRRIRRRHLCRHQDPRTCQRIHGPRAGARARASNTRKRLTSRRIRSVLQTCIHAEFRRPDCRPCRAYHARQRASAAHVLRRTHPGRAPGPHPILPGRRRREAGSCNVSGPYPVFSRTDREGTRRYGTAARAFVGNPAVATHLCQGSECAVRNSNVSSSFFYAFFYSLVICACGRSLGNRIISTVAVTVCLLGTNKSQRVCEH